MSGPAEQAQPTPSLPVKQAEKKPGNGQAAPPMNRLDRELQQQAQQAEAKALALADLARSGIDETEAANLSIRYLTPTEAKAEKLGDCYAYHIPYGPPDSKGAGGWAGCYRRLTKPAKWSDEKKDWRYHRPGGASLHLYFHPKGVKNGESWIAWSDVIDPPPDRNRNYKRPPKPHLYITEGEKKAAKACMEGIPCIGISGVENWQSMKKKGWPLLPDFDLLDLNGRALTVIYDSDHEDNINIRKARMRFLDRLTDTAAAVVSWAKCPPGPEGAKQGLDDLLRDGGREAWKNLLVTIQARNHRLEDLNNRYAYVHNPGAIWDGLNSIYITPAAFRDAWALEKIRILRDGKVREVKLGVSWMEWLGRRTVRDSAFAPGKPPFFPDPQDGHETLNTWAGPDVLPVKNDHLVNMFYQLFNHVCAKLTEDHRRKVLAWHLAPLRFAGMKNHSALLTFGPKQGVGKSMKSRLIRRMHGKGGKVLNKKGLEGDHNMQAANATYTQMDEFAGARGRQARENSDRLKDMITADTTLINPKNINQFEVDDYNNYDLTSNELDPVFMDENDSRWWVVKTGEGTLSEDFYRQFANAILDKTMQAALWHHLLTDPAVYHLNKPDAPATLQAMREAVSEPWPDIKAQWDGDGDPPLLFAYNPGKRAETTSAKRDLIRELAPPGKLALLEIMDDLTLNESHERYDSPLYTAKELSNLAKDADPDKPPTAKSMGRYASTLRCPAVEVKISKREKPKHYLLLPTPEAMPLEATQAQRDDIEALRQWMGKLKNGKPSDATPTGKTTLREACLCARQTLSPADRDKGPCADDLRRIISALEGVQELV